MAWNQLTLGDSLNKLKQEVNNSLTNLNAELVKAQDILSKIDSKITALQNSLSQAQALANSFVKSGIYFIVLSPAQGAWDSRLVNAANRPPLSGSFYSVIFAIIAIAPDVLSIASAFDSLLNSIQQELLPPRLTPPSFDLTGIAEFSPPKFNLQFDLWNEQSLDKLFPNLNKKTQENINEIQRLLKDAQNTKNAVNANIQRLQSIIAQLQSLLNDLNNTGVYEVFLNPNTGLWIDRLKNESNAPPSVPMHYSTGMCIVGIGKDLSEANDIYQSMQNVLLT